MYGGNEKWFAVWPLFEPNRHISINALLKVLNHFQNVAVCCCRNHVLIFPSVLDITPFHGLIFLSKPRPQELISDLFMWHMFSSCRRASTNYLTNFLGCEFRSVEEQTSNKRLALSCRSCIYFRNICCDELSTRHISNYLCTHVTLNLCAQNNVSQKECLCGRGFNWGGSFFAGQYVVQLAKKKTGIIFPQADP